MLEAIGQRGERVSFDGVFVQIYRRSERAAGLHIDDIAQVELVPASARHLGSVRFIPRANSPSSAGVDLGAHTVFFPEWRQGSFRRLCDQVLRARSHLGEG